MNEQKPYGSRKPNLDFLYGRMESISKSIDNMTSLIESYADLTGKQLNAMDNVLFDIKEDIKQLNVKTQNIDDRVKLQNSRVSKLEDKESSNLEHMENITTALELVEENLDHRINTCPGKLITDEFRGYKKDMKPIHVISTTNWRFVTILILITAFLIKLLPDLYTIVISEIWEKLEWNISN